MSAPLRAACLTPIGRGAVATIHVEGSGAAAALDALVRPASSRPASQAPIDAILFARWRDADGEEVVVARRGTDAYEIHCHGGRAASAAVLADLAAHGAQVITWQEWLREQIPSPVAAAAAAQLAQARTLRTAAILLDQHHGALERAVKSVIDLVACGDFAQAIVALDLLLSHASLGRHLVTPFDVVLLGRPNVGKSSLLNALVGFERAIVYREPGTTRDLVGAETAIDGWPVHLNDSAGVRKTSDALEAAGIDIALNRAATADLILLILEAPHGLTEADRALLAQWPAALPIANKADLGLAPSLAAPSITNVELLRVSAVTGEGIPALLAAIATRLVPAPPPQGAGVPFTAEQIGSLEKARWLASNTKPQESASALRKLLN